MANVTARSSAATFKDKSRSDILVSALVNGRSATIQDEVRQGFDLNATMLTSFGHCRLLHEAVLIGNPEMVSLLLALGADPSIGCYVSLHGFVTPLEFAKRRGSGRIVEVIERHIKEESEISELSASATKYASKISQTEAAIRRAEDVNLQLQYLENRARKRFDEKMDIEIGIRMLEFKIEELVREKEEQEEELRKLKREDKMDEKKANALRVEDSYLSPTKLRQRKRVLSRMRQEQGKMAAHFLGDIFECVVCLEVPSSVSAVYSCGRCSNVMCDSCAYRMETCPSCRQSFSTVPFARNRAAEKTVQRIGNDGGKRCARHHRATLV